MFKWTCDEFRRSQSSIDSLDYLVLLLGDDLWLAAQPAAKKKKKQQQQQQ